jgi:hypothetical protein
MKKIFIILLTLISLDGFAWDFTYKINANQSKTSNVNQDSTNISDTISDYYLTLQTKQSDWKVKLKGQLETYQTVTDNDFYSLDLSTTYNRTPDNDISVGVFQTTYHHTPVIYSDTASDNNGVRVGTNFYNEFTENHTGVFTLSASRKNYSKLSRQDTGLSASIGLESYFTPQFNLSPDFSVSSNSSSSNIYSTAGYSPSIYATLTANDKIELFASASYSYSYYLNRKVLVKNKNQNVYQEITTQEVGAIFSFIKNLPLTIKYTSTNGQSNYTYYQYKANLVSFGLGLKF